jgi:hypothetical protein
MNPRDILTILPEYGMRWVYWRALYDVMGRTGCLQAAFPPVHSVDDRLARALGVPRDQLADRLFRAWNERRGSFFLVDDLRRYQPCVREPEAAVRRAEDILRGSFLFFSRCEREMGNPPDWRQGMESQALWPDNLHWSRIPDLSDTYGDIKHVWELSRFSHVYSLVRAYAVTEDIRYAETFWEHIEDWARANPPERGPQWRCAQEMGLRCMAWLFGLYAFRESRASTPERIARLIGLIWYHAAHIEKIHWFAARCVRNNHAISEAVALLSIGVLLPFLPGAGRWERKGLQWLAEETAWQIYDDGSYVQHSMNYARLVAQLCTWSLGITRSNGIPKPKGFVDRAVRLLDFLEAMQDPGSGRVPNYGSNDGALLFPLSACDYLDYRPSLNALSVALRGGRLYPPGPWDEEAAWFCGPDHAAQASRAARTTAKTWQDFPIGGYYRLQGADTHALIRCATYYHRPAQADMLHLDVWYHGHNILLDPGTYSYNPPPPWADHFVGTAAHNTVTVDGRNQMRRGSRFMWLGWTRSRLRRFEDCEGEGIFEGEHLGYHPVVHRRKIVLQDDLYIVLDELEGDGEEHTFRLHWLVNDLALDTFADGARIHFPEADLPPLRLVVIASAAVQSDWVRADEKEPRGWQSLYYGERTPAWSFACTSQGSGVRFATVLGAEEKVRQMQPLTLAMLDVFFRGGRSDVSESMGRLPL